MPLSEIVNVVINRETSAITQQGFGIILIAGPNPISEDRYQVFSTDDLPSIAAVLYGGTDSLEYKAAQAIASQSPAPSQLALGKVNGTTIITDDAGTYTAGNITVTINGTPIVETYDTDKDTTLTNLAASIQADANVLTAVYNSVGHTITITPVVGTLLAVTVDLSAITGTMTMSLSSTATEDYDTALDAIVLENPDFYGVIIVSRETGASGDIMDVAAWTEANDRFFICATAESDAINTTDAADTTSIPALLKANSYVRTAYCYSAVAATQFLDAAWLATMLVQTPGSYTGMFRRPAGITVDVLTTTQSTNVRDKNGNTFETIASKNIMREGTTAEGEYIDVIVFSDWVKARTQEGVYGLLTRTLKVPYDDTGIDAIAGEVAQVMEQGITNGGFTSERYDEDGNQVGGYYITKPNVDDIPTNTRANRILPDLKATGFLAGAIHVVDPLTITITL